MSGKSLLAKLLGTSAVAAATSAVASGKPDLSAEDQAAGTVQLENLVEAAHAEGVKEGRKAERERFGAVLTDDGTTGKLGLAISLLSTTDLAADTVIANLKAAPSAAETVGAAEPAKTPPSGQQTAATDPLKTGAAGDAISQDTPLIDPGASAAEDMDEKQIAGLWQGAIANVDGGVTSGGVWDFGTFGAQPSRTN